jgi:hypothetical protein
MSTASSNIFMFPWFRPCFKIKWPWEFFLLLHNFQILELKNLWNIVKVDEKWSAGARKDGSPLYFKRKRDMSNRNRVIQVRIKGKRNSGVSVDLAPRPWILRCRWVSEPKICHPQRSIGILYFQKFLFFFLNNKNNFIGPALISITHFFPFSFSFLNKIKDCFIYDKRKKLWIKQTAHVNEKIKWKALDGMTAMLSLTARVCLHYPIYSI